LDDKRKGEIARAFLKFKLKEDGFEIDRHFRRRIGNIAKNTGLPFEEVLEFSIAIASEILTEVSEPTKAPTEDELAGFEGHGGH